MQEMEVVGSIADLKKKQKSPANKYFWVRHGKADNNTDKNLVAIPSTMRR